LHMAWAAWCGLALWRMSHRLWMRALALLYPCITAFTVVATGNHFVLDLLGGLAVLALSLALLHTPRALRTLWRRSSARRLRVADRLRRGQGTLERTTAPAYRAGLASSARAGRAIALSVESSKRRATDAATG
jgi:PAP2 superfamily